MLAHTSLLIFHTNLNILVPRNLLMSINYNKCFVVHVIIRCNMKNVKSDFDMVLT